MTVNVQQSPQSRWIRGEESREEHRDHLGRLADTGVDWFVLQPPPEGVEACVDGLTRYAELVIRN